MATPILLSCPECKKQLKAPPEALGKKIRCKACGHTFAVPATAAGTSAPAAKPSKAKKRPAEDDDDDQDPYAVTHLDLTPRCPHCAAEMESADAFICLECGYNARTREHVATKKVHKRTGVDWTLWLAPGILCVLAILGMIGFDIWYVLREGDSFMAHGGIKLWIVIMSLFAMFFAGKFAVKRLILHPVPPEIEKK